VIGAVVGGLTLGAGAAVLAAVAHLAGLSAAAALGLAAVAAFITAGSDLNVVGRQLPSHPRQVNEQWLDRYRAWVYGAGFGWQIGVGVSTYIMTAAVYLVVVLAALTANPLVALALGALFGLVRGLAILLASGITSPARLRSFHRRFAAWAEPVRKAVIGVQLVVAVVASTGVWGGPGAVGSLAVAAVMVAVAVAAARRSSASPVSAPTPTAASSSSAPSASAAEQIPTFSA
jgi:hypothetical protein